MSWIIFLLLQLCGANRLRGGPSTRPSIRQLCQFSNPTWIENIAVRSNGQLLVTLFSSPELYQIDPFDPNPTPELVARFPNALGILGITELEEDVFAITKGNFSSETGNVAPASFSVWKADLRGGTPALSRIADVPAATILNGVSTVKQGSKFVILADSMAGVLWRVNLETAEYDIILNSTATQPTTPFPVGWGANGVHARDGNLFFTNSDRGLYRARIHDDGTLGGRVEVVANLTGADDFTFDARGQVYLSRGRDDVIGKVTSGGELVTLDTANADAPVLLEGNTAVAFGRTTCDRRTLYVATNGGWSGLVPGTAQVGGRVLAIDLGE
ncbi:hypothetical protein B0H67DRAFT_484028 [Lasiosphaeris hirsuta]|uniref:SMP-30/Gluconolactonase/LRE-like region domain-containing protein n=1 Tax=Lasiosphaeris hirsuta TaxID=260670 RepID=A0AA40ASC4_9PEZI|nr:hypothetical protein B0H67DRAFT_484028 [Lasiosphaeris hirsuta]